MAINTPAPDFVPDTASGAFGQAFVYVLDLVVMVLPFALFLLLHLVFIGLVYVFERVSSRSIHPPILMSDLSHHAHVVEKKKLLPSELLKQNSPQIWPKSLVHSSTRLLLSCTHFYCASCPSSVTPVERFSYTFIP